MRKLLIATIMLQTATLMNAQITKGDVQLNGALSFQDISNSTDITTFRLNSNAGLFLSEKTSLGISLNYTDFSNAGSANNFQFGVYSRMHKKLSDQFYLFLQPAFLVLTGKDGNTDISGFVLSVRPGLTYFMNQNWAIDLAVGNLGYSSITADNGNEVTTNSFDATVNITGINLGLAYYFKSKK